MRVCIKEKDTNYVSVLVVLDEKMNETVRKGKS
jgi:hypothetical protein